MIEQIGKVTLDYKFYPGQDFYCDGAVEDELLTIVKNNTSESYQQIIEEKASWPILYHLSSLRENIIDWIPVDKSMKVLEVGSGCGAITGALSRKAGSVTCIDLSKKRSHINAYRHQECDNIYINVGNFKDVESELPNDFDYIFLIGVFEYGKGYMGSDTPYVDFMNILKKHLKKDGRIVIAIENKFGLKYWAGCKEDHVGTFFAGIEDYPQGGGVRTFTRNGLEKICASSGITEYSFYYPYPDYKFMTTVYSDKQLPKVGELSNNLRNFDRSRLQLFDEKNVFDTIIREGLFPLYSNSYIMVIGKELEVGFAKFSNDRAQEYAIRTDICMEQDGKKWVEKTPLSKAAVTHVTNMEKSYHDLSKRFEGSKISINNCELAGEKIVFQFVEGKTLEELFDECMEKESKAGFLLLLQEYVNNINYNLEANVSDLDLIFGNIIVDGDKWHVIDYEWTFEKCIPTVELLARALYCYSLGSTNRKLFIENNLEEELELMGVTKGITEKVMEDESKFQKQVTGQHLAMSEIRNAIGYSVVNPYENLDSDIPCNKTSVQIYEDFGKGFVEENAYFVKDAYIGENEILCEIKIPKGMKALRIDPAMEACVIAIKEFAVSCCSSKESNSSTRNILQGKSIFFNSTQKFILTNGHKIANRSYVFATNDPNITVNLTEEEQKAGALLTLKMEITPLSISMAQTLSQ